MDRFEAMQAFVRVVEAGSFTRAAHTLQTSRTRVTQLVQYLEAHLQVRLLNRTTRQVAPTAEGNTYYVHAARLLADLDDADTSIAGAVSSPRGRMRVDVPSAVARLILIPALPAFHARYPEIQLQLGVSDRTVDLIGEHVDCVVRGGEPTASAEQSLVARRVADLALSVVATPGYLARTGHPSHPEELQDEAHHLVGFVSARTGTALPLTLQRGDDTITVHGRHALCVDDGNAYLAAGLAGLGVLCVPDYMSREHVARGALVRLFDDWHIAPMPLYVAYPQQRNASAKLRVFIAWVTALLADHAAPVEATR